MVKKEIVEGTRVTIRTVWNKWKTGVVVSENPAQLGKDLVEIKLDDGEYVCIERKHLQIAK